MAFIVYVHFHLMCNSPLLLLVPLTFLTIIGLFSFYSLNPCFATVLLSINIPIALLSKSALTVTPSCISNFSTPIFNYTSLSILKVCLISLCLPSSFAMLLLLYCTFPSLGHTAFLSSFFTYPYHFSFSNCLLEITPCPLFCSI